LQAGDGAMIIAQSWSMAGLDPDMGWPRATRNALSPKTVEKGMVSAVADEIRARADLTAG
jgi:hypothetical protein